MADLTGPLRALAIMFYSCQLDLLCFDAVGSGEQYVHYLGFCPASGVSGNCSQVINDCWHYLSCFFGALYANSSTVRNFSHPSGIPQALCMALFGVTTYPMPKAIWTAAHRPTGGWSQ